jgi:tetratricopeptide (TPR) repeat protein
MTHTCKWTLAILLGLASPTATLAQDNAASTVPMSRGVELAKRAQNMADPAAKAATLREAEQIYTEELKRDPKSGAAINNLAVISVRKGDTDAARKYFQDAIASDDGHKALYALNYSKFLQASDPQAAIQAARLAVKEAPNSSAAKEQLGTLLWQTNPAELIPFAYELVSQGESELATRFAPERVNAKGKIKTKFPCE